MTQNELRGKKGAILSPSGKRNRAASVCNPDSVPL
jgi:hypothetical protein